MTTTYWILLMVGLVLVTYIIGWYRSASSQQKQRREKNKSEAIYFMSGTVTYLRLPIFHYDSKEFDYYSFFTMCWKMYMESTDLGIDDCPNKQDWIKQAASKNARDYLKKLREAQPLSWKSNWSRLEDFHLNIWLSGQPMSYFITKDELDKLIDEKIQQPAI